MNNQINEAIKKAKEKSDFIEMISKLMHSNTQVQIFHRQTKSLAEHMALGTYYDAIQGPLDGIVESYQGKNGIISKYTNYDLEDYQSNQKTIEYFGNLAKSIEKLRKDVEESYIQNQIDTLLEIIYSTLYKLKFLK